MDSVNAITRGITDTALLRRDSGYCERATNLVYNSSGRLAPHPGWRLLNKAGKRLPRQVEDAAIDHIFVIDRRIVVISAGKLFEYLPATDTFRSVSDQTLSLIHI